ncbi:MAG: hypothetical protein AB9846_13720 [Tenuifilaceae bacterium]
MKTKLLLPNQFKKIGWYLLVPSSILGFFVLFFEFDFKFLETKAFALYTSNFNKNAFFTFVKDNLTNEIVSILFIIGAIFVAFSKEKIEDEFIEKTRLESLVWATYINYAILLFCTVFFFEIEFLTVMILNMFSVLIFFIIRFYYILYRTNKSLSYEK